MKKKLFTLLALAACVFPMFAATAVFQRKMPAKLDLTFANSITFYPVITYVPKNGNAFIKEQNDLGKKFISALSGFAEKDGKFLIINGNADIAIQVSFKSFDVKDSGVTVKNRDSNGITSVVKDEWNRQVSALMEVTVLKTADNSVLASEEYKFFGITSDPTPKSMLMSPEKIVDICDENGFDLPLLLAQAHQESCFGMTNRARRTNSVWSVGSYDNGKDVCKYANQNSSIQPYINLMKNNYLADKTIDELLSPGNFVNKKGLRYAQDKNYEGKIKNLRNRIINKYPELA